MADNRKTKGGFLPFWLILSVCLTINPSTCPGTTFLEVRVVDIPQLGLPWLGGLGGWNVYSYPQALPICGSWVDCGVFLRLGHFRFIGFAAVAVLTTHG